MLQKSSGVLGLLALLIAIPQAQAREDAPELESITKLSEAGKTRVARKRIRAYLETHPEDAQGHLLHGRLEVELDAASKNAMAPFYKALKFDNKLEEAWVVLGKLNKDAGQMDEAARVFLEGARLNGNRQAGISAGQLFADLGKPGEALRGYRIALRSGDLDAKDWLLVAAAATETKTKKMVKRAYVALARLEPNEVAHRVQLARILSESDPKGAKTQLEKILQLAPNHPEALDVTAALAESAGDDAQASDLLARLLQAVPAHPTAHARHGDVLARAGKNDLARAAYDAQLAVGDEARAHLGLARLDRAADKPEAALEHARKSFALDRRNADTQLILGELAVAAGQAAEAVEALTALASKKGAPAELLFIYGRALLQSGSPVRAKAAFSRLLAAGDVRAHEGLGDLAWARGEFLPAAKSYVRAAKGREKDADYQLRIALAYLKGGKGALAEKYLSTVLQLDPDSAEASRYLGRAKLEKGDIEGAKALLVQALKTYPDNADVNFAMGKALYLSKQAEKAAGHLDKALAKDPVHGEANALRGVIKFDAGDKEGAKAHLEIAATKIAHGKALAALGEIRVDAGDFKGARKLLSRALEADSAQPRALLLLAKSLHALGVFDQAEKRISEYTFANAADAEGARLAGAIAHARGELRVAATRYDGAKKLGALPAEDGLRYGDALVRMGRYDEAAVVTRAAIAGGATSGRTHSQLAYAQFKSGDKEASRKSVQTAIEKGADDSYVHIIKGEELLDKGDRKAAKEQLEKVLKSEPRNDTAHTLLGDIAKSSGDLKGAIQHYQTALASNPAHTDTRAQLVRALIEDGKPGRAKAHVDELAEAGVDGPELATLKGRIEHGLGNYKKAQHYYEVALKGGDSYEVLVHQGENYLELPHYDKAIAALEKAKALNPESPETLARLAELYAEVGDTEKASAVMASAEAAEEKQVEAKRKELSEEDIKVVAVGTFENLRGRADDAWIAFGISESLTADLSKVAYLKLVERKKIEELKAQVAQQYASDNADILEQADLATTEVAKMLLAEWVLLGSYNVLPGNQVTVSARLVELGTNAMQRASSRSGPIDELGRLQKEVALELAGEIVDISDEERRRISRLQNTNPESFRLASQAKMFEYQGDSRAAQAAYREAVEADAGNVSALRGLQKSQEDLGVKNTVAINDFEAKNGAPTWIGAGIPEHLAGKLAQVSGIQVVERSQLDAVKHELAFEARNEDYIDTTKLPALAKALSAGAFLAGSYQVVGTDIQLNARMIDIETEKVLLGAQVMGPEADLLKLQDELAKKIVYALVGAPSEEELAALESKQTYAQYKAQMEQLDAMRTEVSQKREEGDEAAVEALVVEQNVKREEYARESRRAGQSRVGVGFRLGSSASGMVPGVLFNLMEIDGPYGAVSWDLAIAGDNFAGGRPVESQGSEDTGEASFSFETGLATYYHLLEVEDVGLSLGGSANIAWVQHVKNQGLALNDDDERVIDSDFIINLRPAAHASYFLSDGIELVAGLGYQMQFRRDHTEDGSGLFVDLGAHIAVDGGNHVEDEGRLAYRTTLLAPGHQPSATQFVGVGSRGILMHSIALGLESGSEDVAEQGIVLSFMPMKTRAGGDSRYYDIGWEANSRLYQTRRPLINPMIRVRAGLGWLSGLSVNGAEVDEGFSLSAKAGIGAEIAPMDWLTISALVGHDWIYNGDDTKLSGYTGTAGVSLIY